LKPHSNQGPKHQSSTVTKRRKVCNAGAKACLSTK
jgi:hypothetical protein